MNSILLDLLQKTYEDEIAQVPRFEELKNIQPVCLFLLERGLYFKCYLKIIDMD